MFYGLFLRGHSVEALRRDIDIPKPLLRKWLTTPRFEPNFRDNIKRVYQYRKQVLAIFEELVGSEKNRARCSKPPWQAACTAAPVDSAAGTRINFNDLVAESALRLVP